MKNEELENKVNTALDDSVKNLDSQTTQQLFEARQKALDELKKPVWKITILKPVGAIVAGLAVVMLVSPIYKVVENGNGLSQPTDFELMASADNFEMVDELEFTGYATIAAQTGDAALKRLMAVRASKLDAYRLAAEYVYGIYLDSNTTVGSLVVSEDEFSSRVEGVIMGAELVRVEPVSEDTYATTVALSRQQIENIRREYIRSL